MSETYATGDRVKVTLSGTYEGRVDADGDIRLDDGVESHLDGWLFKRDQNLPGIAIEKVVPPVEPIKEGDLIKHRIGNTYLVLTLDRVASVDYGTVFDGWPLSRLNGPDTRSRYTILEKVA